MSWRDWFRAKPKAARTPLRRSVFTGAAQNRLLEDWVATYMSGRDETRWELRLLKNRAREQTRNNPMVRRYLGLLDENVLGPEGIVLQAQETLATGEPDEETNQQIERAFAVWGESATCTVEGRLCWRDVQGLVLGSMPGDGEILVERVIGFPNAFGFALRLWDADLLDEDYHQAGAEGRNAIVAGVELDRWGRHVAYHLWTEHPTAILASGTRRRIRVEATNMRLLGRPRRVGQVRYEPWLSPVLFPLRQLDEYMNAELIAARQGAEHVGFIQQNPDAAPPDPNDPTATNQVLETSKGMLSRLGVGETVQTWDSGHPNQGFDAFLKAGYRQVAAGLNVAYASLTGDMSQANYSSTRVSMLGERDNWQGLQRWLTGNLHAWIYEAWLRQAVIYQQVRLPGRLKDAGAATWQCRGWDWVDPQKDIDAALTETGAGLNSLTRIAAAKGLDFRTILQERKREMALAEEAGVKIVLQKAAPAPAPDAQGTGAEMDANTMEDMDEADQDETGRPLPA